MAESDAPHQPGADFLMAALWDAARPAPADIPGYEILGEISRGGMGAVYHARQLRPGREVAIKVLLPQFADEPEMLARFQLEARAMAGLDHPGILPVYEVGEADGMPFFSMKLAEGGSLADRLKRGPPPPREAASLIAELARAVHHAHQHGVLHRDLKPGNFLFTADGRACVSDFGLAKLSQTDHAPLTRTESFFGTPHYMPPEVAAGSVADSTVAGDLYSMGAVFYECLTGRRPHDGRESMAALLRAIADDPIVAPAAINPSLPRDLSVICMKALERNPRDRYASLADYADDLERWLAGKSIAARPAGVIESVWRWARRHPLPASLLGALLIVTATGGILLAVSHAQRGAALRDSRAQLHRALIEQARTERLLGSPGHRQRAIALLERAAAIEKSPEIRAEVAALLCRPDLVPVPVRHPAPRPPDEPMPDDPALRWQPAANTGSTLSWHESGIVRWWVAGRPIATAEPAGDREIAATLSPDGKLAVFAGTARGVVVADASGNTRVLIDATDFPVSRFAAINPANSHVALAGSDGLRVIGITHPTESWHASGAPARCAPAWSGDGARLAVALGDRREVRILSAADGTPCAIIPTSGMPEQVALDARGELLAVASGDGMLAIHDAADGLRFSALPHRSQGLSFEAPARLRSLAADGAATDWTIERPFAFFATWWEAPRIKVDGLVSRSALSPDGEHLLTVSAGCAALWSVREQRQSGVIPLENQRVDDRAAGWWLGNDAILIQVPGGLERVPVDPSGRPGRHQRLERVPGATVLDVLANGDWLVSRLIEDGSRVTERWQRGDPDTAVELPEGHHPPPTAFHIDGQTIEATGAPDSIPRLTLPCPAGIADACVACDGRWVIVVTRDHRVMSWRTETLAATLDAAGF